MKILFRVVAFLAFLLPGATAYTQQAQISKQIDSLLALDQYYVRAISFGTLDLHEQDSIGKLGQGLYGSHLEKVTKGDFKYGREKRDSLNKGFEKLCDNNFSYIKFLLDNNLVKKMSQSEANSFFTLVDHFTLEQFNVLDSSLQNLVSKKIIKPLEYATDYDLLQVKNKLPQKYFVLFNYNKETGKSCTQTPPDINQTNLYRKKIGLKNWKFECYP